jgi:EXPERA (EXPanded EBP superfamily)
MRIEIADVHRVRTYRPLENLFAGLAVSAFCRDTGNTAKETLVSRKVELVFAALFALFFIGWLIFDMPVALGLVNKSTGWYATEVDPIFLHPPTWLRTVGWFAFAYGPFYLVAAFAFFRSKQWLPYLLLPLAGMVVTSTGIYMVTDATGDVRPLNPTMFSVLNGPYIVVPVLAAIWVIARTRKVVTPGTSTSA